jgi:hypothetical protein
MSSTLARPFIHVGVDVLTVCSDVQVEPARREEAAFKAFFGLSPALRLTRRPTCISTC